MGLGHQGLAWADFDMNPKLGTEHFMVVGASGSGKTVLINRGDSMTDKHMGYVQLSRARESTFVYSGPIEDDTMKELARLMEKSRVKEMVASLFHWGVGL